MQRGRPSGGRAGRGERRSARGGRQRRRKRVGTVVVHPDQQHHADGENPEHYGEPTANVATRQRVQQGVVDGIDFVVCEVRHVKPALAGDVFVRDRIVRARLVPVAEPCPQLAHLRGVKKNSVLLTMKKVLYTAKPNHQITVKKGKMYISGFPSPKS